MTESETIARREIDQTALAETVREALAQLKLVEDRLQSVLHALSQPTGQVQAAATTEPIPSAAPPAEASMPAESPTLPEPQSDTAAVDTVAWEVAAEDMEIPITHPSHFQPGQTIAIGDGPTREIARIRTIMGTRLLCVRGIDDSAAQHHDRGRNIYIVH